MQSHPAQWEGAVKQAVAPVDGRLAALGAQQGDTAAAVGRLEEQLSEVAGKSSEMAAAIGALQVWPEMRLQGWMAGARALASALPLGQDNQLRRAYTNAYVSLLAEAAPI